MALLTKLPPELHLPIYDLVFTYQNRLCLQKGLKTPRRKCPCWKRDIKFRALRSAAFWNQEPLIDISLLLTCKTIATEATPILYNSNAFNVAAPKLRNPLSLRATSGFATLRRLHLMEFLHRPGTNGSDELLCLNYLRLLKKWLPKLETVSFEYDGRQSESSPKIPMKPTAIGKYSADVELSQTNLKVIVTCPSIQQTWQRVSTSQFSLKESRDVLYQCQYENKVEDCCEPENCCEPEPRPAPSELAASLTYWLAMEAFDRGELGYQELSGLAPLGRLSLLLEDYTWWLARLDGRLFSTLRAVDETRDTAALAYVNSYFAQCSAHCVNEIWQ